MLALLRQPASQLAAGRRLARSLQTEHQDDPRPGLRRRQSTLGIAEEGEHLVAHDRDHLLRRRQALENVLVNGLVADPIDERLDDLEIDVRFEQRHADLAQRSLDGLLRQAGLTPQGAEDSLEPVTKRFEHGSRSGAL